MAIEDASQSWMGASMKHVSLVSVRIYFDAFGEWTCVNTFAAYFPKLGPHTCTLTSSKCVDFVFDMTYWQEA